MNRLLTVLALNSIYLSQARLLAILALLLSCTYLTHAQKTVYCEDVLPPGYGFGGAITLSTDCLWRPQVHFVSTVQGEISDRTGALTVPTITLASSDIPDSTSGPNRVTVNDVVLANFSLTDPFKDRQVLWPKGLLVPGLQPGTTLPRRLYLQDVQLLVDAGTLQQYLRFFRQNDTLIYTDNATFLHIPFYADTETLIDSVGLLLGGAGLSTADLAQSRPALGRNFVVAADQSTLLPLLQNTAATSTAVPFLIYLVKNVSLDGQALLAAGLPVNRPLFFVGRVMMPTSINFGMEVNQLVALGTWSSITFSQLVLENLAPGDARSMLYADRFDVLMGYNIWSLLYPRTSNRLAMHNCTLVLSMLELEEYLYKATLFNVQPAGFPEALQYLDSVVTEWQVEWVPELHMVQTAVFESAAMSVLECNYTIEPVVAPRLPLPGRANDSKLTAEDAPQEHSLTHVDALGVRGVGSSPASPGTSEMLLLTTNMSFGIGSPANPVVERQLQQHIEQQLQSNSQMRHIMMGINDPSVTLDMGYSTDLLALPANVPPGHLTIVNVVMLRLSQGPAAMLPGANMQTPDVWTHLLWSFPRPRTISSVWLSNVTLWVPAAEFSYIRSYAIDTAVSNFSIELNGAQPMRFTNVRDMKAEGVFVEHYSGPGLMADSMWIKLEAGWSQEAGGPKGFWNTATGGSGSGRMSDAVVVVLAVCLVTAVVASVLACLAVVLWRKRTAEARMTAAATAAAELGKAGFGAGDGFAGQAPSNRSSGSSGRRAAANNGQLALLVDNEPVHDSSDSYPLQERAQLTSELARSQFGVKRLGSPDGSEHGGSPTGGRVPLPGAAGAAAGSNDAALQRLHSAITTMSQDVLSRRLQVSCGNTKLGMNSAASTAGGAPSTLARPSLARPSPLGQGGTPVAGAAGEAVAGSSPRAQQQQQQEGVGPALSSPGSHSSPNSIGAAPADPEQRSADSSGAGARAAATAAAAGPGAVQLHSRAAAGASVSVQPRGPSIGGSSGGSPGTSKALGELKLLQLVGQGTFGSVYKALWRRRCVAVKVLQLPATAGGSDAAPWMGVGRVSSHREKMAVMETVVSTTMSHPNIVQVYTYVLQPLMSAQDGLTGGGGKSQGTSLQDHQQQRQQQQAVVQPMSLLPPAANQPQPLLPGLLQQQQQQQQGEVNTPSQQQQQELAVLIPPTNGAAAGLLDRGSPASPLQQQQHQHQQSQQQQLQQQQQGQQQDNAATSRRSSLQLHATNDSSQSLGDLSKLTPEMAAAAAAALPAAAAAGGGGGAVSVKSGKCGAQADHTGSSSEEQLGSAEGEASEGAPKSVLVGWELRLVMEFCDAGSLRSALDHKLLIDRTTGLPALECVLFLAHDVACAMIHLHSEHLLHGDLKASNVLLKRTAPRLPVSPEQAAAAAAVGGQHGRRAGQLLGLGLGLMAKVADFGLSLTLGPADTHVSQMHMGTLTHMAPELLLHGRASKASDVYAYGILLWELATGRRPYSGTPVGMLAHKVAQQGWRPAWPGGCCQPVQLLTEACWAQEAADRPSFEQIVAQLEDMAGQLDSLKQQQAQQMAAAAAPLCSQTSFEHPELELGHELTPSLMEEFMPSGFSAGSEHSGGMQIEDGSDTLYEMSQLSGCSQDREQHQQQQQQQQQQPQQQQLQQL